MGTLSTIGILADGSLGTDAQTAYRDGVAGALLSGISIGSTSLPAGSFSLEGFSTDTIDVISEKYPAWYGYYVNGLLQNIAKILDIIPDTGILAPFIDPTKPVVIVIAELQEQLGQLGDEVKEVLLSQLDIVIEKSEKITAAIEDKNPSSFYDALVETINEAYAAAGESADSVIAYLEENKDKIEEKARELMFIDEIGAEIPQPEIDVEVPSLEVPSLDISFMMPGVDTSPLFYTVEVQGVDGIGTKFIKLMTAFLAIPAEIAKAIYDVIVLGLEAATSAIQKLVDAISSILTNVSDAIQQMLEALLDIVWGIISLVIDIAEFAYLEISSVINIVIFFVKYFIISLIGFLIGAGLVSYKAAQFLEIL